MPRRLPPVPDPLLAVAGRQAGLVSVGQCLEHGVTRDQAAAHVRRGDWQVAARTVYDLGPAHGTHPVDHARRRAAVLGVLAHPGAVATGLCALVLHGVLGAPQVVEPEVTLPTGAARRPRPPVRLRRIAVRARTAPGGFPAATVPDALVQAVPALDRRHAVALMDSALHQRLLTPSELTAAHASAARHPGIARTHGWWSSADGDAESPAETWARLSCVDSGCPPDVLQLPVADGEGRPFARIDLAWLLPDGRALLVEIDGRDVHSTPEAVFADRRRQNRIVTPQTVVRRFSGRDAWRGEVGPAVRRELLTAGWYRRPVRPGIVLRLDG
ncbi:hypothetical protein [Isoptericola sp. NPDC019482]|uniref:hypothetical protein n=1 Tax=Isoptericola sp. NPDC019482 TaxID=3154688 RepID=UPI003496F87B